MSKAAELAALIGSQTALSNRNLIINGAMQVAQRGTSGTSLDGYQAVDRFKTSCGSTNTSISVTQETDAPVGFKNSLKYEVTSAAGSVANSSAFQYKVEGQDMSHLEWGTANAKTVTLSFYVKCSQTISSLGGSITNSDFNMTYPFDYGVSAANTWEKKEITIEGPTTGTWLDTNGIGLDINFNLGSASARLATKDVWANTVARGPTGAGDLVTTVNATWQITGVQLEVGETAMPFEHRSFGDELQRCQRYYEKQTFTGAFQFVCNSLNTTTTQVEGFIPFNTEKRVSPTVTSSAASTWRVNAISNDATASGVNWFTGTKYGVRGQWTRSSGTHVIREASYINVENASPNEAYISVDAEL